MASVTTIGHQHSPYISDKLAGADLTGKEGYAVKLSAGAWVLCDTQGEKGYVLIAGAASGKPVSVAVSSGIRGPAVVNSALATIGSYLTPAATTGKWEVAASGDVATAMTLTTSAADGDVVEVITKDPHTI